ncbi:MULTISPECIES: DUF1310 family protein [unclassified Granulicatella]|jgi:hypothetical secreted protein|uniref:DUF1310 family protein n=1 Tax=unclassified Granulicatella TaxID=2630493 RepID=UPI002556D0BB|nr:MULTISPECIES: DUF1310 family protein [unclassified Granulicatella]MDK8380408.1 DUF1310 family protein [Granulicatella sp. UMB5615B]MDK8522939.1 DUF1310 family protein [Granulicatella sp. UMB5615A]
MNITRKIIKGIVAVLILIGLVIGGIKIMQQVQYYEMIHTVKSEEVQNIIENNLKLRHASALESGDVIQSYQIDMDSINHSPMGGIIFKVYINNDKQLYVHFLINKDLNSGKLVHEGGGTSEKFSELIRNQK